MEKATFAAGCFWGVEAAFREVEGVVATAVGFMGGKVANPSYQQVCYSDTGHAEVCEVTFDPEKVSYEGDLFGQTVNLASRLVTLARPHTVLVSDELGRELANDPAFELRPLRPKLKGIGRVQAWVLRAASAATPRRQPKRRAQR